jgi:hypothetical protein
VNELRVLIKTKNSELKFQILSCIKRGNEWVERNQCNKTLKQNTASSGLFFFYLVREAIGTAATPGLLCQLRVIVNTIVDKQMECRVEGETEVLG